MNSMNNVLERLSKSELKSGKKNIQQKSASIEKSVRFAEILTVNVKTGYRPTTTTTTNQLVNCQATSKSSE